jgi:hypothetical protein
MNVSGGYGLGRGSWWIQRPGTYSVHGKVSHVRGIHQIKTGVEGRFAQGFVQNPFPFDFSFSPNQTADTFIAPDTRLRGHPWASFLLGALDNASQAQYISGSDLRTSYYGVYVHDDVRLTRRITLNLGLRYEDETGVRDVENRISRYLDLSNPIPEMQASPPNIPDSVRALNNVPYSWRLVVHRRPESFRLQHAKTQLRAASRHRYSRDRQDVAAGRLRPVHHSRRIRFRHH